MTDLYQPDPYQRFLDIAERDGVASTSTNDGFVFLFKRSRLISLLLDNTTPSVKIAVQSNGVVKEVSLSRNELQMNLDANPDAPMLMVIYTHESIKN